MPEKLIVNIESLAPIDFNRVLKKKTFMSEELDQPMFSTIKLKSLEDKRKKDDFLCIDEWDLPNLFRDPVLTNQKMI